METYVEVKEFVDNPDFKKQKLNSLEDLKKVVVDYPIQEIIKKLNALPYCFTLQCCYGHFVYEGQKDNHNIEPLPESDKIKTVDYRIAYLALCLDNNKPGRLLKKSL